MTKEELDREYYIKLIEIQKSCNHIVNDFNVVDGKITGKCVKCDSDIIFSYIIKNVSFLNKCILEISWKRVEDFESNSAIYDFLGNLLSSWKIEKLFIEHKKTEKIKQLCFNINSLIKNKPYDQWFNLLSICDRK